MNIMKRPIIVVIIEKNNKLMNMRIDVEGTRGQTELITTMALFPSHFGVFLEK